MHEHTIWKPPCKIHSVIRRACSLALVGLQARQFVCPLVQSRNAFSYRPAMPIKVANNKRKQTENQESVKSKVARKEESHLYTDDNPETTLHGTGFADQAAAQRTLQLVRNRSTTYQFQVINTMYHRAKHHPHPNARMQSAMDIFQEWLDQYQTKKEQLPKYKTVKRLLVEQCLKALDSGQVAPADSKLSSSDEFLAALSWAKIYAQMPTGKRLANTLTTTDPEDPDMDSLRTSHLQHLVPANSSTAKKQAWRLDEDGHRQLSDLHLQWILFGYTPVEGQAMACLRALK